MFIIRRLSLGLIMVVFISQIGCTNKTTNQSANGSLEKQLQISLTAKDYFNLSQLLSKHQTGLSLDKRNYYSAYVASAFNHPQESILRTNQLLKSSPSFVNDSMRVSLLMLQRDNYVKTFQYKKAAYIGKELLAKHSFRLGLQLHDVENTLRLHQALATTPAQQISIRTDSINWKRNRIGLLEIPVQINQHHKQVIVDTRAHLSTVTKRFAKQVGLRMLPVSYEESSGITGKRFSTGLGIADSLYIGHILIRHVVFQVVPDEVLYFPLINYQIQGILGFPVITALNQVRFVSDGRLIIGEEPSKKILHNLAFDQSTTVVSLKNDEDTLSFHFDTGATGTEFYSNYFTRYKSKVMQTGVVKRIESGGAGGILEREVYVLPEVTLYIGSKKVTLKEIAVHKTPSYKGQPYLGNVGQDVINQFHEMTLNFKEMYLLFQ